MCVSLWRLRYARISVRICLYKCGCFVLWLYCRMTSASLVVVYCYYVWVCVLVTPNITGCCRRSAHVTRFLKIGSHQWSFVCLCVYVIVRLCATFMLLRDTPVCRRLLWHGSRTTNFAGILSQGLRIAPPEAPVTGYVRCPCVCIC